MIGDHFSGKWRQEPYNQFITTTNVPFTPFATKEEFEALKKEVLEMKALLIKAKEYDEKNNEPNCEMEDKVKLLKQVADMVGVDLKEIFGK
jgi:hypothetical protein